MILKASQRMGAADLATHLMNGVDNELVEVAEVRGTVAQDLQSAFAEYEAAAAGTRCKEPLYSLSLSPPVRIDRAAYFAALDRIEQKLGLSGQPRAVVFHIKDGREHCHAVWSRIHVEDGRLKAIQMSHDHARLMDLSVGFFRELEVPLPDGLTQWADRNPERFTRPGQDFTRAEKEQSAATGETVAERRKAITDAFRGSDSSEAFVAALEAAGYTVAIGDKRAFVVLDRNAQIFSLARQVEGATTRDVKAKLAGIAGVPDVQKAKAILSARAQARLDRVMTAANAETDNKRRELDKRQRLDALVVFLRRVRQLRRDAEERLVLKAKHKAEMDELARSRDSRLRKALSRVPGVGAIIRYFEQRTDLDMLERQRREREALERRQKITLLRHDRTESHIAKVHHREALALGRQELCKEMRKTMLEHRQALKEGRISASFGIDKKPADMSDLEWIARGQRRGADDAERRRRVERNQERLLEGRTEHVEALKDSDELLASNPTIRAYRENAADMLRRSQPAGRTSQGPDDSLGSALFRATDTLSEHQNDVPETDRQRPPPTRPSPDNPSKGKPH